jgi:hypothetical protein
MRIAASSATLRWALPFLPRLTQQFDHHVHLLLDAAKTLLKLRQPVAVALQA